MVHVDLLDLLVSHSSQLAVRPDSSSESSPGEETCSEVSLTALQWLDSLTDHLLQNQLIRQSSLLTLLLSSQGRPLLTSAGVPAATHQAGERQQLERMQRAAEAAGMAVTAEARGSLPVLPQEITLSGGRVLDPGAVVMTPQSAMMAMVSSSGQYFPLFDISGCHDGHGIIFRSLCHSKPAGHHLVYSPGIRPTVKLSFEYSCAKYVITLWHEVHK
jgi:hypothetical protein